MPLFKRHDDKRHRLGLLVAIAAHVERNTPQLFPKATTDRLEAAADELLSDVDPVSFETAKVVERIGQSLRARRVDRPWFTALLEAIDET